MGPIVIAGARRVAAAIVLLLGLLLGGAWWVLDPDHQLILQLGLQDLVLFVAAATVMELLPIRLADGRALPTSLAVVGAAALLGAAPPIVALIAATAYVLSCVLAGVRARVFEVAQRAAGGWMLAGIAAIGAALGPTTWSGRPEVGIAASINLGAAAGLGLAIMLGVPAVATLTGLDTGRRFALRRVAEEIQRNWLVGASIATTAALGALVHPVLGAWTLPTMLLPLVAARAGLDRLALGQRAYDQTIRAMSRLPEQLGTVSPDHGVRVAELSREVALELGLDAATVAETVRAAHLHELGRIKVEREAPAPQHELATAGADVLREVGDLDRVADILAAQANLHDSPRDSIGLPARIIVACCELDGYAPDPQAPGQRHEAVVRLVREVGDLEVVAAMSRVLDRTTEREPVR